MPNEDLAATLISAQFARAPRGYAVDEVDELVAHVVSAIRGARSPDALEAVVEKLEQSQFTPEPDGYDPFGVRNAFARAADQLRTAIASAMLEGLVHDDEGLVLDDDGASPSTPDDGESTAAATADLDAAIEEELDRLAVFENDLADRLARLAPADNPSAEPSTGELVEELARLRAEIQAAAETLRTLLREVTNLRERARTELRNEIDALRERWIADLQLEVALRQSLGGDGDEDHRDV